MLIGKNILKFIFFIWLTGQFFIVSCTHDKKNELVLNLEELSTPYPTEESSSSTLKLNYYDISPYVTSKGFLWQPFILATSNNYKVSESELLLGYMAENDNLIFPPQSGSCKILQKSEKYTDKKKKLVSFLSSSSEPEADAGNLFLLLDNDNLQPYAIIKLNKHGTAHCYLPSSNYHLSYNFGLQRKEFVINTEDSRSEIKIEFLTKGYLKINPDDANNIQNGDLLRIGRKFEILADAKIQQPNDNLIPTQIDSDLFKPSNFLSQIQGVDEIFQTSFLIGHTPFSLQLEEGSYKAAILRKNTLICLTEIKIENNAPVNLKCPKKQTTDLEEKIFNRNEFNISFDTTFFPEQLNQEAQFQQWFLANKENYIPILFSDLKEKNNKEQKKISFLFLSNNNDIKQFPENFDLKINDKNSFFPIFGTDMRNIIEGAVPFTNFTTLHSQYQLEPSNILSNSALSVTNGVDLKLLEPFLAKDGSLTSSNEQRFRIRITVPSWNSTKVVEMYIDGKLHRRWILNRGDLSQPLSTTLDDKTFQEKDFVVRFVAWGDEALPDFLFGLDGEMPYARTRDYFVAIAGAGR